ncbi:MAG: hypothetical protein M3403_01215 [Gemmatimonadota bacterium]|nr:hypothetical protein [Gemmatimonadota bacterium]
MLVSPLKRALAVVVVSLIAAGVAVAGPPWIAIESPVNPHDPATRDAFMTVRTYHHGELLAFDLSGTAEGLVNGQRSSTRLDIRRLAQPGTYAVRWQKPAQGSWVLVVSSMRDGQHMATAVVTVDNSGRVSRVSVPSRPIEGGRWQVPRAVAAAEVNAILRGETL